MIITFADGENIEVAASALDDFLRYDLKWAEFVHGRAFTKEPSCKQHRSPVKPVNQVVHPCPPGGC